MTKLEKNLEKITKLKIDNKSAIDLYLDISKHILDKEYINYVKNGTSINIDYLEISNTFLEYFKTGEINLDYCHDFPYIAESIIYKYYCGILKKDTKTIVKLMFLNNLALNGAIKSKEYHLISNDKITRVK